MSKIDYTKIRRNGAILGGRNPLDISNAEIVIPKLMPWGKYKDLPIDQLPITYVEWLLEQWKEKPTDNGGLWIALMERKNSVGNKH